MEQLLTNRDLASRLCVPLETVRFWRKQGTGPRALKLGRHVRYLESDVQTWLAKSTDQRRAS